MYKSSQDSWPAVQEINFYQFSNSDVLRQLYISLVRPHLEYACHVWAPHTSKDINELENVQKFVCKMANHQWNGVQYDQLLSITNLHSLERRTKQRLCHLFKIVHNLPSNVIVHREEPLNNNFRSFHNSYLHQPYARTNSFYNSFVPHTISLWKKLPETHSPPYIVLNTVTSLTSIMSIYYPHVFFHKY